MNPSTPALYDTLLLRQEYIFWVYAGNSANAVDRLLIKGAVVATLCQNEAEVKFQMDIMDIDHHISTTEQAGKIRVTEEVESV